MCYLLGRGRQGYQVVVVHVDDFSAIGEKTKCDQFGRVLNQDVPISNLGELRWFTGCRFSHLKRAIIVRVSAE